MMNEKKWKIQITFLKILVRKAMLCNFTFPVCPSWPKNVFYCCKQNRMNFYHEILTTCILVMKASYQIESMGFFFLPLKRKSSDFVFILMALFDHAKEILSHAKIIGWFCFYILSRQDYKNYGRFYHQHQQQ